MSLKFIPNSSFVVKKILCNSTPFVMMFHRLNILKIKLESVAPPIMLARKFSLPIFLGDHNIGWVY